MQLPVVGRSCQCVGGSFAGSPYLGADCTCILVARLAARSQEVGTRLPGVRQQEGEATRNVCDRWALDVVGPFPKAGGGERYVMAAVEYVTRYVVAVATE
ncbi:hypothetical protein PHMEG_00025136 [Phytophthora megakarya]|uniref:Uncharacterized protein n=1 Tax=Phytophthora megakarya TaxID=4795 RepID=A0A225VCS9_9STRA|nr:hypothetical protein PHMEG_00025136 [Phytophthora megakarya]